MCSPSSNPGSPGMDAIGVECQFTFCHLSEDKNTAVFTDGRGDYKAYLKRTFGDILRE